MKEITDIAKKIEKKQELTETEMRIVAEALKEQSKCIEYYSQNFIGNWNCDEVNVNWRAIKCNDYIKNKMDEIQNENTVVIDVTPEEK